ncbi:hypothetical protein PSY80_24555, partial [Shigella flexneri]|nr:hypothetical protein [Shigella flexneri]
ANVRLTFEVNVSAIIIGPNGSMIIAETLTSNVNRTLAIVRLTFEVNVSAIIFGPNGSMIIAETLTSNVNRTIANVS